MVVILVGWLKTTFLSDDRPTDLRSSIQFIAQGVWGRCLHTCVTGPNFYDWLSNLRIVLQSDRIIFIFDKATPEVPPEDAPNEVYMAYN